MLTKPEYIRKAYKNTLAERVVIKVTFGLI